MGLSNGNAEINKYNNSIGIIVPPTGGFRCRNVKFYNFAGNMTIVEMFSDKSVI